MFKNVEISALYDLDQTIAKDVFQGVTYPWEVLPKISEFIVKLGESLSEEEYEKVGENVWIARDANVFPSAYITIPAIIGKGAEVRQCAFIRGMPSLERGRLWVIPRNLRMSSF